MKNNDVHEKDIITIEAIIIATEMYYEPKTILGKIIRDADCAHISSKNYSEYKELLRKEWEVTQDKFFTDTEWIKTNIDFLTNQHGFHTNYATLYWEKQKSKNLAQLLNSLSKDHEISVGQNVAESIESELSLKNNEIKKYVK